MSTRCSYISFLMLSVITVSFPAKAADDYLMKLVINGKEKGEFLVSRDNDNVIAEADLWRAAGVNANTSLPINRLKGLGRVKILWTEQTIYFFPYKNTDNLNQPPSEITIQPTTYKVDIKSADYNITHHSQAEKPLVGSIIGTGKAGVFDIDIRAGIGIDENYFSGQWHNEENKLLKDVQIGRIQRHGLDGLSVTNERSLATGLFSTDKIELYWPIGTRVDVYCDGSYIESIILDSEPYQYLIELNYSNNHYEYRAVLPDGRTDTKIVERSVSGRLAPVGELNYRLSVGRESASDVSKSIGYIGYGLGNELSLFAGHDDHERSYLSTLYARDNLSFEPVWYGHSGWTVNGNWQKDVLSIFGRISLLNGYKQESVHLSHQNIFRPTLQYTSRELNSYEVQETTLKTFHHTYITPLRTSISLSPSYSIRERNGLDADVLGARILATSPNGWQAVTSYEHERQNSLGLNSIQRFQGELSKRFSLGRITYRYVSSNYGQGWATQQQSLRTDLWQWPHATVSLAANCSSTGEEFFSLSISGSFSRNGFRRIPQQNQATLELSTCRDLNADGVCQKDEPEVTGITARLGDRVVVTPAVVDSLTPYRQYKIQVSGDFGLSPRYKVIDSGPLTRGGINRLRLPLSAIREVEGQLEKDGIRVALVEKNTGSVVGEQTTAFGGWYLFYAPSHLDVEVVTLPSS